MKRILVAILFLFFTVCSSAQIFPVPMSATDTAVFVPIKENIDFKFKTPPEITPVKSSKVVSLSSPMAISTNSITTGVQFHGPSPYLSLSDSPLNTSAPDFQFENFEDRNFNMPGLIFSTNGASFVFYGSTQVDSVDNGHYGTDIWIGSRVINPYDIVVNFAFDPAVLGGYPSEVGMVWTDGYHPAELMAWDANGNFLGTTGIHQMGNGENWISDPTEDRFFGVTSPSGISQVSFRTYGLNGLEMDHFQFGSIVPMTEVLSVKAIPDELWIDADGAASGIVFEAETNEAATVEFKVTLANGTDLSIGSKATEVKSGKHIAQLSWWGTPTAEEGICQISASAGTTVSSNFTIHRIDSTNLGNSDWMIKGKDPTDNLTSDPNVQECPLNSWDQASGKGIGYFSSLNVMDPVNIVSGNFIFSEVDLKLKSRHDITLARIYNSLDGEVGPFGKGWSTPYTSHLIFLGEDIQFVDSDGGRILFKKTGDEFLPARAGVDLKLSFSEETGFWSIKHPKGSEWTFDSIGKVFRIANACCGMGANDAVVIEYENGNIKKVTNQAGHFLEFTTDANGKVVKITDSSARELLYSYDLNNNLVSYTNPIGQVCIYECNDKGQMTEIKKPGNKNTLVSYENNRVKTVTDPMGNASEFTWDTASRKLFLKSQSGEVHEYLFNEKWIISGYELPAVNMAKNYQSNGNAIFNVTDSLSNSRIHTFGENNLITGITDKLGNTTSYEYHPDLHKLTKKTDSLGRTWTYDWCYRGNLIKKTDPAGNETKYTYDSHNNRTSVTDALGHVTRYVYDSTGNYLLQTIDPTGNISSYTYDLRGNMVTSTDKLGRATSYEYDLIDRIVKTTYPDGRFNQISYDEAGNVFTRVDNLGRVTAYSYDANGRLLSTTRPDGTILSHAYDAAGRKISSTDALGRITSYEYDALDNLVKVIYPDQAIKTYVYDTEKRLTSSTDELGNITAYEYDPMGRMLATIDPAGSRWENQYDAAGRKIVSKDPLCRATTYQYDVLDRTVKVTAPDSSVITSNYDAIGNLLISTNALNQQTTYEYDALNRQIKVTNPNGAQFTTVYDAAGQVISSTDALGNSTSYTYDIAGRKLTTTNALGQVSRFTYDNAGRLVNTINPLNQVATVTYDIMDRAIAESDTLGRLTRYEYDQSGKRIAKTDAMGRRFIFAYDSRDRLTTEVDGEGRIVSHAYDSAGRKVSLTDGAGRIWRWAYDSLGRVLAEIDPLGNEVKSSYDVIGNLILKTNARAQSTGYEYNLMNRLVKITYPDATTATFSYDVLGRELVRSNSAAAVEKSYDVAGNLISEKFVNQNKSWNYSFDLMGNRIQAISPENETLKYKYDKLYRLVELDSGNPSEKINYSYDALGRTIEEKRADSITANTFDAASQLLEMKHYKLVLDRGSHGCGKFHKNKKKAPTYKEEILALRQYSYDLAGNRISMTDENNKVTSYSYDKSNWLTQVVYPNADVVTYVYNDAGDRISEQTNENPAVTYSYDAAGRMIAKGDEAYNYDADGNMLSDSEASYIWNSDNRLLRVEKTIDDCKHDKNRKGHGYGHLKHSKESVAYEEYTYLPQDWRRITRKTGKIQSDSKKKFGYNPKSEELTYVSIYDGADESHEYLVTEPKFKFRGRCNPAKPQLKIFREFIGGPGSDDIAYTRYNHLSLAMLKDGLGSTIALTSKDGKAIARIGYDAWGEFRWNDKDCKKSPCKENEFESYLNRFGTTWGFGHANHNGWAFGKSFAKKLTPYLYTGRRYSEITNQYFNRNRYYSPALGRFISKDPIGFNGGMNLYRYADNNPVLFTDPTGQFPITIITLMKLKALVIGIDVFFWFQNVDYHCDKLCPGNGRVWPLPATFQVTGNQYRLFQYKPQENENALVDNYVKSDWRSFEWGDCFYRFLFVGDPEPPFIQNQ